MNSAVTVLTNNRMVTKFFNISSIIIYKYRNKSNSLLPNAYSIKLWVYLVPILREWQIIYEYLKIVVNFNCT